MATMFGIIPFSEHSTNGWSCWCLPVLIPYGRWGCVFVHHRIDRLSDIEV